MPNIQVFGVDDNATRAALRFFRERRIVVHYVDLQKKPIAAGELRGSRPSRRGGAARYRSRPYREGASRTSRPTRPGSPAPPRRRPPDPPAAGPLRRGVHGRQGAETWKAWLARPKSRPGAVARPRRQRLAGSSTRPMNRIAPVFVSRITNMNGWSRRSVLVLERRRGAAAAGRVAVDGRRGRGLGALLVDVDVRLVDDVGDEHRSESVIPEKSARSASMASRMPIASSDRPSSARVSIPNFGRDRCTS